MAASKSKTCKDCEYFWKCLENSRLYPCRDFKQKGKPKDEKQIKENGNRYR